MRKVSLLINIVLASLLVSSCAKVNEPLKIGFVGGLSGSGSDLSVTAMYGAMLAVETINASGGIKNHQVQLVIENDKSDPQVALESVQSLIEQDCRFIIGPMISSLVTTTVPYINEQDALLISPTISFDSLSGIDDHFIRLIPSNATQAALLFEAISSVGTRRLSILVANRNALFAQAFIAAAIKHSSNNVTLVETRQFDSVSTLDVHSLIDGYIEQEVDSLLIIASGDEIAELAQMFELHDYHPTVFMPMWAMTNDLIVRSGRGSEGFYGVNNVDFASTDKAYLEFKARYLKSFGQLPTFSAVMAYESIMLLAEAMESSESFDPVNVKHQITSNNNYRGMFGDLEIDQFGDAVRPLRLFKIRDGKFVEVEP